MNANDARIAKLTVAQSGGDIQEVAPNAPATGTSSPGTAFDLVLEMEAGGSVAGNYNLTCTCFDHTDGVHVAAMDPGAPLNGSDNFQSANWFQNTTTNELNFDNTVSIGVPGGKSGHVFSYTVALVSTNGQQVDTTQSPLFTLV